MTSAAGGVNLYYDPLGRLRQMSGGPIVDLYLLHDGIHLAAEYRINDGAMLKRYVFGPGVDEPLVEYDVAGTRTWLHADERGSIIALSDGTGNVMTINRYDEYGRPQSTNLGRFQYTGQAWLKEIGVQYSKARMYDPASGRFLQTDPIGYEGGANVYAYVYNDPVNLVDPTGLDADITVEACGGYWLNCHNDLVRDLDRLRDGPGSSSRDPNERAERPERPALPLQRPKPPRRPNPSDERERDRQLCRRALTIAGAVGGVGLAADEGLAVGTAVFRGATTGGIRGGLAGPLGILSGAVIGGGTAWVIFTYGPDVIEDMCNY